MSRRRTSAANLLAIALLIISLLLLPLHLPVARARHVAVLKATDSASVINIRSGDVGVVKEPISASGVVQRPASSGANHPGGGRRPAASRTVEMRTSTWTKHRDEVPKMHEMLRDYASKVRRRSLINNGEPSLEDELH